MTKRNEDRLIIALVAVAAPLIIWAAAAGVVFQFRHPWATSTERFIYTWDALMFRYVPYDKMRRRYEP